MAFFLDYKILKYSIVNTLETTETKKDSQEPYPFIEFVKNLDIDNIGNEFVVDSYNKYLIEWTKIKNQSTENFDEIRRQKYVDLLKNIQLNFLNQDEIRILGNINFDDPLELDVAIPFFVEKIKDIIEYYINKRRDVKNSKAKWSTKGSKRFLENVTAKYIIDNYTKNENTFQRYKQSYQELSDFQKNYRLKYDGLYDLNDYRKEEFSFDPSLFLSSASDYDLSSLPITSFGDYSQDESTLISELKKDIYKKYISTDRQYFSGGSSVDVDSTTPFYDPYNYNTPYVSRISDTSNLLRDADIGYYFTSKYIYTSNYYSPYGISTSNTDELVGLLPKIDVYRSEDYKDYYFWSKYSATHQGLVGKPVFDKRLKRFYGYQSRDLNIDDSVGGVERHTDDIQLWGGDKNETWSNEDIFDKFNANILNRDAKNNFLFVLEEDESVYKYVCDIYGNQYYLIKKINTPKSSSQNVYTLNASNIDDSLSISNISLLGQRFDASSSLDAIQIQENVGLGFFISTIDINSFGIESLDDYGVIDVNYYSLSADIFNTEKLSSEDYDSYKSIYENQYTVGRLYVRDVNSKHVKEINAFLDTGVQNIINVDIINDFIIFTTTSQMFTAKIIYDFSTSELIFQEIIKNKLDFYNNPLQKSASYWYDTKNESVYFADVLSLSSYGFYYIETESNRKVTYIVDDNGVDHVDLNNKISFKYISKPQLLKNDNFLYLVILLSDVCENYYYQILKYEIVSRNNLKAVSNTVYHPSKLRITNDIKDDPVATTNELSSFFTKNYSNTVVRYWDDQTGEEEYPLFYAPDIQETHYDNDDGGLVVKDKPDTNYDLGSITEYITPEINPTATEDLYTYEIIESGQNVGYIYTPVNIRLSFREMVNFSSYVEPTEPIYKIEYYLNGKIKTRYILENREIATFEGIINSGLAELSALAQDSDPTATEDLSAVATTDEYEAIVALNKPNGVPSIEDRYNNDFLTSPVNMKYLTFTNDGSASFSIKFYSLSGKAFRFDFNFIGLNFSLSQKYNKVELLDARIRTTDTDQLDCLLYLNTRKPDSIINTSLLNI